MFYIIISVAIFRSCRDLAWNRAFLTPWGMSRDGGVVGKKTDISLFELFGHIIACIIAWIYFILFFYRSIFSLVWLCVVWRIISIVYFYIVEICGMLPSILDALFSKVLNVTSFRSLYVKVFLKLY